MFSLSHIPLFSGLKDEDLESLQAQMHMHKKERFSWWCVDGGNRISNPNKCFGQMVYRII